MWLLTDLVALELLVDFLERTLHAKPKVDFLDGCTARRVSGHLGDLLDFLDPAVDITLQLVQKRRV